MEVAVVSPLVAPPPASWRDEAASLLRLSGPLVGSNLLQMAIAAVDVIFVARLGSRDLAAATLGAFMFNLAVFALIGLTGAAAPLIAAELGRRAHAVREVRRSFRMALWVGLFCSAPVMILLSQGEALLRLAGQDAEVSRLAGGFLWVILIGMPLAVGAGVMRTAAAALGRPGWTFLVTGLALALDILGNWAFIYGHLGAPAMGLDGSALANVLSFAVMTLAYAIILLCDPRLRKYRLLGYWWRLDWPRARDVLRLGLPIAATWTFEAGLFGGAAVLMGLIGIEEVAAHAIALNIAAFAFQLPFGIAQAATIRVGMAFGAADPQWIRRAGNVALVLGIGIMAATALIMWSIPDALIRIYLDPGRTDNEAVATLARRFLAVASIFQLADGAQAVAAGVLRGLQDTRFPMIIALFGYWAIGFGSSVWLGFFTPLAGVGVWWGLAAGLAMVAVLLAARWRARERLGLLPEAILARS
ncbi:MATE family efflux transporter [Sphingomonas sp. BIUV-7]|uniref:Multidrug-efflux transporter n=1 Tax=Sphingomonas natans TaxID=3063330 RepID=A0ABT8YG13_9SPHN|nr:MATE family efflux transporter [Sphingomonas sp. BIUV-7]MDO6416804.1 MATE family efflux transporter [Sphingomonas sp. BIUV-7]